MKYHASRFADDFADEEAEKAFETTVFKAADVDGDGFLNVTEFTSYYYPDQHSKKVLETLARQDISEADKNHDGIVTVQELAEIMSKDSEYIMKPADVDRDHDGKVSEEELE